MRTTLVALVLGFSLAGCAGGDAATAAPEVTVKAFAFSPGDLTVKQGATVTWTNRDEFEHSVRIDSAHVDGPRFGPGTRYSHRFTKAGTYAYVCGVHNSMTGTVVVTD